MRDMVELECDQPLVTLIWRYVMDMETCGWCVVEVRYSSLKQEADGAMLCVNCWAEYKEGK
jgi:hypothetical protein